MNNYIPFWNSNVSERLKLFDKFDTHEKKGSFLISASEVDRKEFYKVEDFLTEGHSNPKKSDVVRVRKIRLYPTDEQKVILYRWLGATRFIYNKVLTSGDHKRNSMKQKFTVDGEPIKIRKDYYLYDKYINNHEDWEKKIPTVIRRGAIDDILAAYKTSIEQKDKAHSKLENWYDKGNGNLSYDKYHERFYEIEAKYNLKKRKKKENHGSFSIPKTTVKKTMINGKEVLKIYPRSLGEFVKIKKPLPDITKDCKICYDRGFWFICIPISVPFSSHQPIREVVALDPGVRTFQTLYSQQGTYAVQQNTKRLKKLQKQMDALKLRRARESYQKTINKGLKIRNDETSYNSLLRIPYKRPLSNSHFKRAIRKRQFKRENLIRDLHIRLVNFLTINWKLILLPPFKTQDMVKGKKLHNSVNRDMMDLSHYKFKCRLLEACQERNSSVRIVSESYTSRTCTNCGHLKALNSKKIVKCSSCDITLDRDIAAARNIFIKSLLI